MNEYDCAVRLPAKDAAADFALLGAMRLAKLARGSKRLLASEEAMRERISALRDRQPPFEIGDEVKKDIDNVLSFRRVGAANCYTFSPRWISCKKHLVYFCGGAFIGDPDERHIRFVDSLAAALRAELTLVCFPLAPTYSYADTYEAAAMLYAELVKTKGAENVVLMGDSTGGTIALALSGFFVRAGLPKPGGVIAFSPVCDLALQNPALRPLEARDCALGIGGLREACRAWCGARPMDDSLLNPMSADVANMPKALIICGEGELLLPDILAFARRVEFRGGSAELLIYKNMFHGFQLYPLRASADAAARVAAWLG